MSLESERLFDELARSATLVRAEPGGEFGKLLRENDGLSGVSAFYIEVSVEDGTRRFEPDGGLTVDHFLMFSPCLKHDEDRADLALAVLRNALTRRGHTGGLTTQAAQKAASEMDLAHAIAGEDFDGIVERADEILHEMEAARREHERRMEELRRDRRKFGGRLTCDPSSQTIHYDGNPYPIKNEDAFRFFLGMFDAGGSRVTASAIAKSYVELSKPSRTIRQHLKSVNFLIASFPGRRGGYAIVLPPPKSSE